MLLVRGGSGRRLPPSKIGSEELLGTLVCVVTAAIQGDPAEIT